MTDKIVTVFGSSRPSAGEPAFKTAYQMGAMLAEAGFTIANGGYSGTMLAAAKGAAEKDGKTIGVTCSIFSGKPNEYICQEIKTASLDERLDTLIRIGGAYIVLPGGTGTLLELAKVWELKNKGLAGGRKQIILIGDLWRPVVELMAADDADSRDMVDLVKEPNEAIMLLQQNWVD